MFQSYSEIYGTVINAMFTCFQFYVTYCFDCALVRGGSSQLGNQETGEPR